MRADRFPKPVSSAGLRNSCFINALARSLAIIGLFSACISSTLTTPPLSEVILSLHLDAPLVIQAGAPAQVVVTTNTTVSGTPVRLLLIAANGTTALEQTLNNGAATFTLEPALTQTAGHMGLLAQVDAVSATGAIVIEPGLPIEPILTLVGPRSLTADGEHWAMLVAIPQDQYANPVADTTPVIVRILHPARTLDYSVLRATCCAPSDLPNRAVRSMNYANTANGDLETLTATTEHLLAWMRIYTRTKAGRMIMAANAGSAHSPERMVLAVPGVPMPFTLAADPLHLTADGQQLLTVRTGPLVDRFDNQLMDGVNVTFLVEDANGATRSLPAQIINGQATVKVQAPVDAGPITVRAFVLDTESSPLSLTFTDGLAVESFPVTVTVNAESLAIRAGPLLGQLGQYIPDGSSVTFHLMAIDNQHKDALLTVTAQSDMGFATGYIRRYGLAPGRYKVMATVGVGRGEATVELLE